MRLLWRRPLPFVAVREHDPGAPFAAPRRPGLRWRYTAGGGPGFPGFVLRRELEIRDGAHLADVAFTADALQVRIVELV